MICAEDFDVSDEPAISSSVSLNTRHYERLQRAEDTWAKLRQAALSTTFQKEGSFVNSNSYHFCDSESGICRCVDCSATAKFCEFCATSMHTKVNILHRVEILKVRKLVLGFPQHSRLVPARLLINLLLNLFTCTADVYKLKITPRFYLSFFIFELCCLSVITLSFKLFTKC